MDRDVYISPEVCKENEINFCSFYGKGKKIQTDNTFMSIYNDSFLLILENMEKR